MAADTPAERVRELLEIVADGMDLDVEVHVDDDGERIRGVLTGDDMGLFIGRRGQTIDAVQHLAYRVAGRGGERRNVEIDADDYRARRAAALERQADEAADAALRDGRPVALEPMSPVERKHVHEYLRERSGVETYSEGEGPERHLVVAPAG